MDLLVNAKGEVCLGRVAHSRILLLPGVSKCTGESSLSEEGACHRFRCENPKVLVFNGCVSHSGHGLCRRSSSCTLYMQVGAKQGSDNILWNRWGPERKTDWCDVASPLIICR